MCVDRHAKPAYHEDDDDDEDDTTVTTTGMVYRYAMCATSYSRDDW